MPTFGQSLPAWASQSPYGTRSQNIIGSPNQNSFGSPSQSPLGNPSQPPSGSFDTRIFSGSTPSSGFPGIGAPSTGFGTSSWGAGATDTSKQPFAPVIEYEMDGQTAYQNICFQHPYTKSSQEELRLGDYLQGHRFGSLYGIFNSTGFGSGASGGTCGFGSASSVLATGSSDFAGSSDFGSGISAFGSGSSGFGGFGQRSYSAPHQAFGTGAQTSGGFGSKPAAATMYGSPLSSSTFNRVGTGGVFPSTWTQQSQPSASLGAQPSSFDFTSLGRQQAQNPGITETPRANPFGTNSTFGQGSNTGFRLSRPTTAPGSFGSLAGAAQATPSAGGLFARTQFPSTGTNATVSSSQAPQPPQQPWQQALQAQPSRTGIFDDGILGRSSVPTGIVPVPAEQRQQTPSPATPPQITARIDDITAYGAPWLFADEKQHQQLPDQGPLAIRSVRERPRPRSMSPSFQYNGPAFATRQNFPSSFGFRYSSRTPPRQPRSRSNSSS